MVKLSQVNPDFVAMVEQLRAELSNKEAWIDLLEAGTGQTMIEFQAGVTTMLHYAIERASQERAGYETSLLDSSVLSLSRLQGVDPSRKISATVTADLELSSTQAAQASINRFSQFTIDGDLFYNPETITFSPGVSTKTGVTLRQGNVIKGSITFGPSPYEKFQFSRDFEASDDVMSVVVGTDTYTRERRSLWGYDSDDAVFLEETLPNGSVRLTFGDGQFGVNPSAGGEGVITYIKTKGTLGNNAKSDLDVSLNNIIVVSGRDIQVTGKTTSSISDGRDQQSASQLRVTSPRLFATGGSAIRRQDFQVIAGEFSDRAIVDGIAWGEHEIDSTDNTNMNVVNVAVLPAELKSYTQEWVGDGSATTFTATLSNVPISKGSVRIVEETSSDDEIYVDDGSGNLVEEGTTTNRGSVNYTSGAVSFEPAAATGDGDEITLTYKQLGLTSSENTAFETYLKSNMHVTTELEINDLTNSVVDITIVIKHLQGFEGSDIATQAEKNIRALFEFRANLLGRDFELSDYTSAATKVDGVDYVTLTSPTSKTSVGRSGIATLGSLTITYSSTDR